MKKLLLIVALIINFCAYSQENKTVTLVVTGQGKTQDEAKQNALRGAIEQAFGTFISSKTEILNDDLVKDEIVSVANGNIQKFEIISEVQLSDKTFSLTLNATVSLTKLTNFSKSKGFMIEFAGESYAVNLRNFELNKKNEILIIENLQTILKKEFSNIFSFKINTSTPKFIKDNNFQVTVQTQAIPNKNFDNIMDYITKSFKGLGLNKNEIEPLKSFNVPYYELKFKDHRGKLNVIFLRNESSKNFFYSIVKEMENRASEIEFSDGIQTISINALSQFKSRNRDYNSNYTYTDKMQGKPDPRDTKNELNNDYQAIENILDYEYYSAFKCFYSSGIMGNIPIDLSFIKSDKVSLLDSYIKINYNLEDLGKIRKFSVRNGIDFSSSVVDANQLCKIIENTNSIKENTAAWGLILGIPAIMVLIGLLFPQ